MKLSLALGPGDPDFKVPIALIQRAEALGFHAVWTAEIYGGDAFSPLAFIGAHTKTIKLGTSIAHLDARTPSCLAMTAQTIDAMVGRGRVIVGLGVSGPQVVEGWHGKPWGKPNRRFRDTVAIARKVWRREGPVAHQGTEISLPYDGPDASGLGKPIKNMMRGGHDIPIYLGTQTPLNVRMAGEIADGWLGFHLVPATVKYYRGLIEEGLAKRTDGKTLKDFAIKAVVGVLPADDVKAALQQPKPYIALYAGGMGAKSMNFHKEAMVKRGFGEAAERVQELFLAGRREEAAAAVPDEYVDEEWLVGPPDRIKARFRPWRESGITDLSLRLAPVETLELMARLNAA